MNTLQLSDNTDYAVTLRFTQTRKRASHSQERCTKGVLSDRRIL
jgi:hypothetical protein